MNLIPQMTAEGDLEAAEVASAFCKLFDSDSSNDSNVPGLWWVFISSLDYDSIIERVVGLFDIMEDAEAYATAYNEAAVEACKFAFNLEGSDLPGFCKTRFVPFASMVEGFTNICTVNTVRGSQEGAVREVESIYVDVMDNKSLQGLCYSDEKYQAIISDPSLAVLINHNYTQINTVISSDKFLDQNFVGSETYDSAEDALIYETFLTQIPVNVVLTPPSDS